MMGRAPTLVLLFTRFPVPTETFLQREVEALQSLGVKLELWSFWGGGHRFNGIPIRRMPLWRLAGLLFSLPYWLLRAPRASYGLIRLLFTRRPANRINLGETLIGLGFGFCLARAFAKRSDAFVLHAVWASLPASVAWSICRLTGMPFSFGAHAYDLFEDGGDMFLPEKCREACWIRTSTRAGAQRLAEAGAAAGKLSVIRRGLFPVPSFPRRVSVDRRPFRILSVGRLVEKMGYALQMEVYAELKRRGMLFKADIVGEGPLRQALCATIVRLGLEQQVRLWGALSFSEVAEHLGGCNLALFTGVVAESGDRAGFPNFVGEAMAFGVPVVATPVGAVTEVLVDGVNGRIAGDAFGLADAICSLATDPQSVGAQVQAARQWVEENFDAAVNMQRFRQTLQV